MENNCLSIPELEPDMWSNDACRGYVIMAMQDCGFSREDIRRVVRLQCCIPDGGVWKFGYECREWDIHEKMIGNPVTDPVGMHFIVDLKDTGAFIDLIYFFLNENGCDGMLRKECFINHLI